jgi:hypothetical protein
MMESSPARFWYVLDPESSFLWLRAAGDLTDDVIVRFYDFLFHHPDWKPGLNEYVDFSQANGRLLTPSAIRLVAHLSALREVAKKSAVVATGRLSFGLMRMFMTYADESPEEIRVFENQQEAMDWVGKTLDDLPEYWNEFLP